MWSKDARSEQPGGNAWDPGALRDPQLQPCRLGLGHDKLERRRGVEVDPSVALVVTHLGEGRAE
jgi:hypothetical protein